MPKRLTDEQRKANQLESMRRYERTKTKMYVFRLRLAQDADVIEWLDGQDNKVAGIRDAVRHYMKGEGR